MARSGTQRRAGAEGSLRAELNSGRGLRPGRFSLGAGVSPRLLAWMGAALALAVLLIFLAPLLESVPLLVQLWLLLLCGLYFPVQLRLANRPHRPPLAARPVFLVAAALALGLQLTFIFAGFYFSDDSIRHIYDGVQILRGGAVYLEPPATLGKLGELMPNHPELATVYLPFTQFQSVLGALLHERYGFPIVYHLICALLLAYALRELPSRNRRVLVVLVLSPFFLIAASSRHSDLQGMLLVIASLILSERGGRKRQFVAGALAGLLPCLKPIGLVWSVFLFFDLMLRVGKRRRPWLVGFGTALLTMGAFAALVLWRDQRTLFAFFDTVKHFGDWFVAYNPIVLVRLAQDVTEQKLIIQEVRREILVVLAVGLFLIPLAATARNVRGTLPSDPRRLLRRGLREALVWVLVLGTLAAAVWHPWYFLWWLPALIMTGRFRLAALLPGLLLLFYVPIPVLRAQGRWDYEMFVFAVVLYLSAWFWLTRNRRSAAI